MISAFIHKAGAIKQTSIQQGVLTPCIQLMLYYMCEVMHAMCSSSTSIDCLTLQELNLQGIKIHNGFVLS